jgi:hypothetical protein
MLSLLSVSTVAVAEYQKTYRLTHLATGTAFITGFADINNKNELAGWRFVDGREASFIWRDGELLDLNPVPDTRTLALAINDRSDVVGIYEDAQSYFRSFLWRHGNVTRIDSRNAPFSMSTYLLLPQE